MSTGSRALAAGLLILLAGPAMAKKKPLAPGERLDLNRASVAELMRLPGIGRHKAEAIAARRSRQPFHQPAEVTEVEGIGRTWFERNQGRLSAGPAAPAPKAGRSP